MEVYKLEKPKEKVTVLVDVEPPEAGTQQEGQLWRALNLEESSEHFNGPI